MSKIITVLKEFIKHCSIIQKPALNAFDNILRIHTQLTLKNSLNRLIRVLSILLKELSHSKTETEMEKLKVFLQSLKTKLKL